MGYATVREALRSFFEVKLQGLGVQHVYADIPWYIDGANWHVTPGQAYGAVLALHIDRSAETRITLPAYTGQKSVQYTCSLLVQYQYLIPSLLDTGTYEDVWIVGRDLMMDTIKDAIRSDQNAGVGAGVVFQMGDNADDLSIESDIPVWDGEGGRVYELARIEFAAWEIITA